MNFFKRVVFFIPTLLFVSATAQPAFEVIDLEGTAKVQRVQRQKWDKISVGTKLADNDIIETYFQTKLTVKTSDGTIVLFGSNCKALLTFAANATAGRRTSEASFSLFNGGMMVEAVEQAKVSVFTTNAVGEIDSGTLAIIVDNKSGETGFLTLGGKGVVRNISQQKGLTLAAGYTSIVVPGREPAPPLSLSYRHVAILKHFFGDKLINETLQAASIIPANDQTSVSSRTAVASAQGADQLKSSSGFLSYPRVFNIGKIYGSILDDRDKNFHLYQTIPRPVFSGGNNGVVEGTVQLGLTGNPSTLYSVVPRYRLPWLEAGLRFAMGTDWNKELNTGFGSMSGLLDKIERLEAGSKKDSIYCALGSISNLTLGNGLLVKDFRNAVNNRLFHPFGISAKAGMPGYFSVSAFLSEVRAPSLLGIHGTGQFAGCLFGGGWYHDFNQYMPLSDTTEFRYTRPAAYSTIFPDTARVRGETTMYELNFCATVAESYDVASRLWVEFAQKRENGMNDGFMMRPSFTIDVPQYSFGFGVLVENGRILSSEFDPFYASRRSFIRSGATADTILTPNTALSPDRSVNSFVLMLAANPLPSLDIKLDYTQAFVSTNAFAWQAADASTTATARSPLDFSLDFRCAAGDSLIPFVSFAVLYTRQSHALLFPATGGLFTSWNSETGFDVLSRPLYAGIAIMLGGRYFSVDMGPRPNDRIDPADAVFELTAGLKWDFP